MHNFEYQAVATLDEAVQLLEQHRGKARLLAGGTDLIDQMRIGRHTPEFVIDVKKIAELNRLDLATDGLYVGAAVPCYRITGHTELSRQYAALSDSCCIIGGIQIQSRATLGGNLCNSGPAADSIPAMIALGGSCLIRGPAGSRELPIESFCTAPSKNVLQAGELVVEIRFPPRAPRSGSHYRRMIPRNEMDIAVVGVGASVELDESLSHFVSVRVGLGAVAPTPLLAGAVADALAGQPVNGSSFARAAEIARQSIAPITDMRGTREYRIHATGVMVPRVLEMAVARARGEDANYRVGH